MGIRQKVYTSLLIIFSIVTAISATMYFLHYVEFDMVMLFLGLSQLFSGLNQMSITKSVKTRKFNELSKCIAGITIALGLTISIAVLAEMFI